MFKEITLKKPVYFKVHGANFKCGQDIKYGKVCRTRPLKTKDYSVYKITKAHVFEDYEAQHKLVAKELNRNPNYIGVFEINTWLNNQLEKNDPETMERWFIHPDTNLFKGVYDENDFMALINFKDAELITDKNKRDRDQEKEELRQAKTERVLDSFLLPNIQHIAKKYHLTYNPKTKDMYFASYEALQKFIFESIQPLLSDLEQIGIKTSFKRKNQKISTYTTIIDLSKAKVDLDDEGE